MRSFGVIEQGGLSRQFLFLMFLENIFSAIPPADHAPGRVFWPPRGDLEFFRRRAGCVRGAHSSDAPWYCCRFSGWDEALGCVIWRAGHGPLD